MSTINTIKLAEEIIGYSPLSGDSYYHVIDPRDIIMYIYDEVEEIIDYNMDEVNGDVILIRDDRDAFVYNLEYDESDDLIVCSGYTWSTYDEGEYHLTTDGGEITDAQSLSVLLDDIVSWAEQG